MPIELPARGIKLQAFEPGVVLFGDTVSPVLEVWRKGRQSGPCGTTPDTVIRGMTVSNGSSGILIDTSLGNQWPASTPDRVRVQRCTVTDDRTGIQIHTSDGFRSQHVIEENTVSNRLLLEVNE